MQVLAKLLIENHQPTPHYRCVCSVGEGGSTLVCQIDCICQRHWSQRMALSMSFFFLVYGSCKVACVLQVLVEQCTATLGGGCTSRSEVHFRKASRPILRSFLARLRCCNCEQCAKVDPKISLIPVRERSTSCSRVQCSQAAGPIHVKSGGR